jgi:hypothetical protein
MTCQNNGFDGDVRIETAPALDVIVDISGICFSDPLRMGNKDNMLATKHHQQRIRKLDNSNPVVVAKYAVDNLLNFLITHLSLHLFNG